MDEWMNGQMDGGWVIELGRQVHEWTYARADGQMEGCVFANTYMNAIVDQRDGQVDGWLDGWMSRCGQLGVWIHG